MTVFNENHARGLPSHLATIVLLDPDTGALIALMDGRYITEARTAAVSAVSARHLSRAEAGTLAIIGSGVQARSHLEAYARGARARDVRVWSPQPAQPRAIRRRDDRACRGADPRLRFGAARRSRRRHRRAGHLLADAGDRRRVDRGRRARRVGRRMPSRSA